MCPVRAFPQSQRRDYSQDQTSHGQRELLEYGPIQLRTTASGALQAVVEVSSRSQVSSAESLTDLTQRPLYHLSRIQAVPPVRMGIVHGKLYPLVAEHLQVVPKAPPLNMPPR
jgi:hypothetical protein